MFIVSCSQSNTTDGSKNVENKKLIEQDSSKIKNHVEVEETKKESSETKQVMSFQELYPKLKKALIKSTCEPCKTEEGKNSLTANSKESNMFLSTWTWDPKTLKTKDIDDDGLVDYTIELLNEGGGCGGQVGIEERWTLFGSNQNKFVLTHHIPYRSSTGKWEKAN